MKRVYTTWEYKLRNKKYTKTSLKRRLKSKEKKKAKRRNSSGNWTEHNQFNRLSTAREKRRALKPPVEAPKDLRLLENTNACLSFFRDLRSEDHRSQIGRLRFVIMSLKDVEEIDYGTISILTALNDELGFKRILLKTILPDREECKQFMIDSGYLNNLVDDEGRPFPKVEQSDFIFFEKGQGTLSDADNRKISQLVRNVVNHLTGVAKHCLPVKTIILEICGNSIEWSGTDSQQWLLGVRYDGDKVTFTVTDVGRGILETLYRRFTRNFFDPFRSNDAILKRAFDKKYDSSSQEVNRNKGLPAVKANFEK
jgi:hypothetical protein